MTSRESLTTPALNGINGKPLVRVWTSEQWLAHFRSNAEIGKPIPWELGAGVTAEELAGIGRSLQAWQRGESSDGNHLRSVTTGYAEQSGDAVYPEVIELFIREEQRHSALMGRFLDLAGLGRVESDWGDRLFRGLRYRSRDLASWATPVIVVEVLALVYFDALRHATASPVLRVICGQILSDEVAHVRFQCERFALIFHQRSWLYRRRTLLWQRILFFSAVLAVWIGHRQTLRAGGYGWVRFWALAWKAMRRAWKLMRPNRYSWSDAEV